MEAREGPIEDVALLEDWRPLLGLGDVDGIALSARIGGVATG
jgi:hypothetical protein